MIAVFSKTEEEFKNFVMDCLPKSNFKRIRGVKDIYGREYVGAIFLHGFWVSREIDDARDLLSKQQPELFKFS